MSGRTAGWLAWSLFTVALAGNVAGMVLLALVPTEVLERIGDSLWLSGSFVLVLLVFGLVGALIASRLPGNPIGWLFLTLWVMQAVTELAYGLAQYSTSVSTLPGEEWIAWFSSWTSVIAPAVLTVTCLLFPDGRLLSPRWRWAMAACILLIGFVVVRGMTEPGVLPEYPDVTNPAASRSLDWMTAIPTEPLYPVALGLGVAAVIVRFRRARGVERAQMKWFAWSASLMTAFLPLSFALTAVVGGVQEATTADAVAGLIFAVLLCGLPVSVGIAILRYRLYDIDRIINRTLVYGALTAILLLTYLGLVLSLRVLLDPLTKESDLAVAASTLAVAALFRPVRSGIQQVVDRRFYRRKYDAARTVESFAGRLRQEVDLDAVSSDLRLVVLDTIAPTHVSLWLRRAEIAR